MLFSRVTHKPLHRNGKYHLVTRLSSTQQYNTGTTKTVSIAIIIPPKEGNQGQEAHPDDHGKIDVKQGKIEELVLNVESDYQKNAGLSHQNSREDHHDHQQGYGQDNGGLSARSNQ